MTELITWDIPIDIINRNHIISISASFTLTCVILKILIWLRYESYDSYHMKMFIKQAFVKQTLSLVFDPAHWIWTRVWVSTSSRFGTKSYSVANIGFSYLQKDSNKISSNNRLKIKSWEGLNDISSFASHLHIFNLLIFVNSIQTSWD